MKVADQEKVINIQDFGDAVVNFIGYIGEFLAVFKIISSSLSELPNKISVNLSAEPLISEVLVREKIGVYTGISFTLSRHEVFQAITLEMDFNNNKPFLGNRVKSMSVDLPEEITFELEFVPRGSLIKHKF